MRHIGILIAFFLVCSFLYPSAPIEFKENNGFPSYFDIDINHVPVLPAPNEDISTELIMGATSTGAKVDGLVSALNRDDFFSLISYPIEKDAFAPFYSFQEPVLSELKLEPKFSFWSFLYLYVALIGFYIAVIINFNKKIDLVARSLISAFVFIHSFFILHICLSLTNYQYEFPHSYAMSTCFSFLYGPLLYLYFKRTTQYYRLKQQDLLHLLPTVLFLVYMYPIYAMSGAEKLGLMMDRITLGRSATDIGIIILKLASLIIYGYYIRKLYVSARRNKGLIHENKVWQKNIYAIHVMYVVCYAAYGVLLGNNITSGFLYHLQIISMAFMVMYIGYSANVQPNVFSGNYYLDKGLFFKYKKSGLTQSLSKELKESLIRLFEEEKIYKENDINLDTVADRLNTSRHNASQVINEHFKMNFHELVNKYRITEAKSILEMDLQGNLNIIDIAYEVGYNNKVTFNKAFKRDTNLTPSEYQKDALSIKV